MFSQKLLSRSTTLFRVGDREARALRRWQSTSNEPGTYERSPAKLYRPYMRPFAKVFLGAMFTYQVLYWAWEKLRLDELREQKMAEMKDLEAQLELYKERQRLEKEQKAGGLQTMQSGLDSQVQGKSKSWFSW